MGTILKPLPVKCVTGIISGSSELIEKTKKICSKKFGPIDFISPIFEFDKTDYYEKEMGKDLKRLFLSFEKLIPAEELVTIKRFTNSVEVKLKGAQGLRRVNIDPGYISLSKLVLATTKSFVHRIYASHGIFEEITLYYKNDTFVPGPWTYPDYQTKDHIAVFNEIRTKYYQQLAQIYGLSQLYRCV